MSNKTGLRHDIKQRAEELLKQRLTAAQREEPLIKCWMSHDARWYMAVASECGLETAIRLNYTAAYELGKSEARRLSQALQLPPPSTVDDILLAQEAFINLLGPNLMDYEIIRAGDNYDVQVIRCFAQENAVRAGIADQFECGVFARIVGWMEVFGIDYEMTPPIGKCLLSQ